MQTKYAYFVVTKLKILIFCSHRLYGYRHFLLIMEIFENYINLQYENLNIIRSYTCMLLKVDPTYKVHGTGIFLQIQGRFFLVSASHVLDDFEDLVLPLENGENLFKPGGVTYINEFSGNRDDDPIDIGFLELDEESVEKIKISYRFLGEDDLAINHKFENQPYYTFLGYPTTLFKFSQSSNSFNSFPLFQFSTPIQDNEYLKFNRNLNFNVVTSYEKKRAYNLRIEKFAFGPDLHGISGCGLWFTDPMDIFGQIKRPKLTAIMTDWPIKDRTKVIGTRIDVLTESLRENLKIQLPESNFVKIRSK